MALSFYGYITFLMSFLEGKKVSFVTGSKKKKELSKQPGTVPICA